MMQMRLVQFEIFRRFLRDQSGATAIEYAVIAGGVAVVIAGSVHALGPIVRGMFEGVLVGFN